MSTTEDQQNKDILEARKKFGEKFANLKIGGKGKD
jgi:hypothetical protein